MHQLVNRQNFDIIIIIIIIVTCIQSMYNYTHKTNHVTTLYSVAAVLYLQSLLHVMLFRMLNFSVPLHQHFLQYLCSAKFGCFFAVP